MKGNLVSVVSRDGGDQSWSKRPPLDMPKNRLIDTLICAANPSQTVPSRNTLGDKGKMQLTDRRLTCLLFCLPTMARLFALVILGTALASCSGGIVGDYAPHWAGGYAKDAPPRPGTPEYDAFRQKQEAEAARDKSKDPPKPKADPGIKGLQ
jgi:hypothetical protein